MPAKTRDQRAQSNSRQEQKRQRARKRGPAILRFEPLEARTLLSGTSPTSTTGVNQGQDRADLTAVLIAALPKSANAATLSSASPLPSVDRVLAAASLQANFDSYATMTDAASSNNSGLNAVVLSSASLPALTQSSALDATGNAQGASLAAISFRTEADQLHWGQSFAFAVRIANQGEADAPATRARLTLTPAGSTPGGREDATIGDLEVPALKAGATIDLFGTVRLPDVPPSTLERFSVFVLTLIPDADFATRPIVPAVIPTLFDQNAVTVRVTTLGSGPQQSANPALSATRTNLTVTQVQTSSNLASEGDALQISAIVANSSSIASGPFDARFYLAGLGPQTGAGTGESLNLGRIRVESLDPGESRVVSASWKLPSPFSLGVFPSGHAIGKILVVADPENRINEVSNGDNEAESDGIVLTALAFPAGNASSASSPLSPSAALARWPLQIHRPTAQSASIASLRTPLNNDSSVAPAASLSSSSVSASSRRSSPRAKAYSPATIASVKRLTKPRLKLFAPYDAIRNGKR